MTLNLSLVTDAVAICVTDRRLSAPAGGIVSERGNKLTAFTCQNARGFITYTGIGRDDTGRSPNDWIAENPLLPTLPFDQFVEALKRMADQRLGRLAAKGYDVRHSFVLGGFLAGTPVAVMISNFESLGENGHRAQADPELSISYRLPSPDANTSTLIVATGDIPFDRKGRIEQIGRFAKKGAKPGELRAKMTKLLRDVAYQADRDGSVGTSVSRIIIPRWGEPEMDTDVVGGSSLLEGPNIIAPDMMIRDVYIDVSGGEAASRYSRVHRKALIKERPCSKCRAPVPEGYRRCGRCDHPVAG
jgi:hypothetical protein